MISKTRKLKSGQMLEIVYNPISWQDCGYCHKAVSLNQIDKHTDEHTKELNHLYKLSMGGN